MIPAGVSYHLYLSNKIVLQPFSGIYLSYGITNKKIDLGLREGVGMSFGKFYTNFGVNFGLIRQTGKVKVDYDYDIVVEKCLQSSAFLSIGYNFWWEQDPTHYNPELRGSLFNAKETCTRGQEWSEPQSLDRLNTIALLELSPVLYWAHSI